MAERVASERTAMIIPGTGNQVFEAADSWKLDGLRNAINLAGVAVEAVKIDWKKTFPEWVASGVEKAQEIASRGTMPDIVGYSMGALTAVAVSNALRVPRLLLLSTSPHGSAGVAPHLRQHYDGMYKNYTAEQVAAFEALDVDSMLRGVQAESTTIVYGTRETEVLRARGNRAAELIPSARHIEEIEGATHHIERSPYADELGRLVQFALNGQVAT